RDPDAAARRDDGVDEAFERGMVGDGGTDETDTARVLRNPRQRELLGQQAHAPGRWTTHDAERALPRATALRLHEEHVGEFGVGREDRGVGREELLGGTCGPWQRAGVALLDEAEGR